MVSSAVNCTKLYIYHVWQPYLLFIAAEVGDFLEDEYQDAAYLSQLKLLPQQTRDIEYKIMEHHKEHM